MLQQILERTILIVVIAITTYLLVITDDWVLLLIRGFFGLILISLILSNFTKLKN